MKTQHTPGPWSVSKLATPDYAPEFAIHAADDDLARTMNGDSEANAALIAAAPDLLAALEGAAQALARALPFLPADTEAHFAGEWLGEVREAIRQAKGDQ